MQDPKLFERRAPYCLVGNEGDCVTTRDTPRPHGWGLSLVGFIGFVSTTLSLWIETLSMRHPPDLVYQQVILVSGGASGASETVEVLVGTSNHDATTTRGREFTVPAHYYVEVARQERRQASNDGGQRKVVVLEGGRNTVGQSRDRTYGCYIRALPPHVNGVNCQNSREVCYVPRVLKDDPSTQLQVG